MFSDVLSGWWKRQMGFDFCFTGKNAQILCFFLSGTRRQASGNQQFVGRVLAGERGPSRGSCSASFE